MPSAATSLDPWLDALLDGDHALAALVVADGIVTAANAAAERLFGGAVAGRGAAALFAGTPEDKLTRALGASASGTWELLVDRGAEGPLPVSFTVLAGPGGRRALVAAVSRDAAEEANALLMAMNASLSNLSRELSRRNSELEHARARSEMVASITAALGAAIDLDEVLSVALARAVGALRAAGGAIFLRDGDTDEIRGAVEAPTKGRSGMRLSITTLPHSRRAVTTGAVSHFTRESAEGDEGALMEALGLVATVAAPLLHGDAWHGVLYLNYSATDPRPTREDLAHARTVAAQCALAIARAKLLESEHEARVRAETAEAAAREAARAQELLTAIVGHDLRTPLSSIAMSATLLLRRGGLADAQRTAVERVSAGARRMAAIVRDLLDYNRVRQGFAISVEKQRTDVGELCRATLEEFAGRGAAAPAFRAEGDTTAEVDPARLAQALSNLVSNALQHGAGSRVEVAVARDGGDVVVAVHNAGPPIPPAALPHIFEPFRRGPAAGEGAGGSVGLGLFIVKAIAERHGGTVGVASDAASGTTFTLRIPRR